tara:strand:- start:219 stop:1247 length:1029 start_codon:yes stop_codon:yes gene_type:complete
MNKIHIILNNKMLTALLSAFLFVFPIHLFFIFIKNFLYDVGAIQPTKINAKIISVGNVLLGGTGKTPTTIAIANFLQKKGFKVGIVTRGHGRKNESKNFLLQNHHWTECGDEIVLLKNNLSTGIPIYISRNKIFAARELSKNGCNVILLDDGFQHRKIYRDIDIVLLGPENYVKKNQFIYPYGLLREPFCYIKRADITISTKRNLVTNDLALHSDHILNLEVKKELLTTAPIKTIQDLSQTSGILSLCSIGDPKSFDKTIKNIGIKTDKKLVFPDHWPFSEKDIDEINQVSTKHELQSILCTEKDYVKLFEFSDLLKTDLYAVALKHNLNQDIEADILSRLS